MAVKTFEDIGKVRSFEEIGAVPSFEEIKPQKKTGLIGEALLSVEPATPPIADPSAPPTMREEPRRIETKPVPEPTRIAVKKFAGDIGTIGEAALQYIKKGKPYPGEIQDRLKNMLTRAVSPLAYVMPGVTRKGLIAELDKEAEKFTGFGPAVVPAAGKVTELSAELIAFNKAFGAVHKGVEAVKGVPKVARILDAIDKSGGVRQFAEKFPRIYKASQGALQAFLEGGVVGTTYGALEGVEEGDILKRMAVSGTTFGGIAAGFSLASSIDNARYIGKLRKTLVANTRSRYDAKIKALPKGMADPRARALITQENLELQQIDNIVSTTEAQLIGMKSGKLARGAFEAVESPQKAAERIIKYGYKPSKGYTVGQPELKKGMGKPSKKPLMPSGKVAQAKEYLGEIKQLSKQTVQEIRGVKGVPKVKIPKPPTPKAPTGVAAAPKRGVKPKEGITIPPKPTQAKPEAITPTESTVAGVVTEGKVETPPEKLLYHVGKKLESVAGDKKIWFSERGVQRFAREGEQVFIVDPAKLDSSKLKRTPRGYFTYEGVVPQEAIVPSEIQGGLTVPLPRPLIPKAEPEAPAAKQQNFTMFATQKGYPSDYDITDHSALSPSGKVSERSRQASIKRLQERINLNKQAHREYEAAILSGEIIDPSGEVTKKDLQRSIEGKKQKEVEGRLAQIETQIRFLSDVGKSKRGIRPSYQKQIDALRAERESLRAKPAPTPEAPAAKKLSPAMKQHAKFKEKYPDTLILMKMGDFYEAFDLDAERLSETTGATLTKRGTQKLAGVPYHQIDNTLKKLIQAGHRVAVVEEVSFKPTGKEEVKRDIVRVVTPGTEGDKAILERPAAKPKAKEKEFEIEPGKFYTQAKIDEAITKGEMGEIEIEPVLETESKSFNKHIDYFQTRQLPETSQIRKIQKQMQIVNGQRLAGTITAQEANKKIRQLRKLLFETAEKEGIALRMTKGGKVSVAVRKAGTYVPVEFAEYTKFQDIYPRAQDVTRSIQQIDGALSVKEKEKMPGQAGAVERNVLWPTREMSMQKDKWLKEKVAKLDSFLNVKKKSKTDKQINLVLEKIAKADRDQPIKKVLSDKTIKAMGVKPSDVKQAVELRKFYDDLIDEQNIARRVRDQEEIRYRHNYSPNILRDATIWERITMTGKTAEDVFGKKAPIPDYIRPNKPFNPREMARKGGIPYEERITSARELVERYIVTAGKDIFNTSIIQSNKAFIQQLEAMGYEKPAKYLADWTSQAYAGIMPSLDRALLLGETPKARKGMMKWNQVRNLAVFPLNVGWTLGTQIKSLAMTFGRYGTPNVVRGFGQWLKPSIRRQAAEDYYSFIVKSAKQGRVTRQDAKNLIGEEVKLRRTKPEMVRDLTTLFLEEMEKLLTGTSIRAAHLHGSKRGLTGEALKNYASDGGAKTQSMYNDEDKPLFLTNLTVKTVTPYQTYCYETMNTLREWAGRTGTPPDSKMYAVWSLVRYLAAMAVLNQIEASVRGRKWSWLRLVPMPFSELWLSPIYKHFTKEWLPGGSGLLSPVETASRVAKGVDDVLETGSWRKLRNELIKYGPGLFRVPAGVQWARLVDSIIAYSQGGVYDRRGKLLFRMKDPQDLARAIFTGVWTTKGGRKYIEKRTGGESATREKRQQREKRMLRK